MRCPFCDYETLEPDGGDRRVQGWQEVEHMRATHPDVIRQRLEAAGLVDHDEETWKRLLEAGLRKDD